MNPRKYLEVLQIVNVVYRDEKDGCAPSRTCWDLMTVPSSIKQ